MVPAKSDSSRCCLLGPYKNNSIEDWQGSRYKQLENESFGGVSLKWSSKHVCSAAFEGNLCGLGCKESLGNGNSQYLSFRLRKGSSSKFWWQWMKIRDWIQIFLIHTQIHYKIGAKANSAQERWIVKGKEHQRQRQDSGRESRRWNFCVQMCLKSLGTNHSLICFRQ